MKGKIIERIKSKGKCIDKDKIIEQIKKRWIIIFIIILVISLSIGFFLGSKATSKSSLLAKLEISLKNSDLDELRDIVLVNGKKPKENQLAPLIEYYEENSKYINSTIALLKEVGKSNDFTLEGKKTIFGEKYYLNINTYNIKVTSNFSEGEFSLENIDIQSILAGNEFKDVIPGKYNIKGELQGTECTISNSKEITLMSDKTVSMNFSAINVTIESIYDDAEIYINDKKTDFIVDDKKELGPFPTDGTISVHLERDFPWGRISSEEKLVYDVPVINIDLDMKNDKLSDDVKLKVTNFYNSVFDSLNNEDNDIIVDATDDAREKIYDILQKSYFILKNKYTIESIDIKDENCEYEYSDGVYSANIVVDIKYEVSKVFFGINKTVNEKSFFTKIIFKDGSWIINDVENFSL